MTLRFTLFLLMYLAGRATAAHVLSRTIGCGFGHLVRGTARGFAHCFKVPDVIISVMKTIWLALSGVLKLS